VSGGGPAELAARPGRVRRLAGDAALAVGFLTIVPVPAVDPGPGGIGRAAAWFPLVGAAVGALAGGVRALLDPLLGAMPATVLAVAALVAVTGALHQDGLADAADGLGVRGDRGDRGDRERRLAAMRDSAIGAYGVLALVGWALLLVASLAELSAAHAAAALATAAAAGRGAALAHAAALRPARADGLGAGFAVRRGGLGFAAVVVAALAWGLCGIGPGLLALGAAAATAGAVSLLAQRAIGGRTGDTLGAAVALTELAVCVALAGAWQPR
jgi:adenosylcobinamide-GDP ribazoletransferase